MKPEQNSISLSATLPSYPYHSNGSGTESSCPISRLPNGPLALISKDAVVPGPCRPQLKSLNRKKQVGITAVCKTWRSVALDCPSYWAGTVLHPRCRGLLHMLPRWKALPRRVALDVSAHSDPFEELFWPSLLRGDDERLKPFSHLTPPEIFVYRAYTRSISPTYFHFCQTDGIQTFNRCGSIGAITAIGSQHLSRLTRSSA
ncbi:hypothetical protein BDV98DRAFT_89273 [Pterulicium gracile]|uniref:F-box domain-containing protein n=1 Tax=Pterulicium gracile TaxID=1884261 RepID=A0A5C3QH71_9AGAR|nr:hypothetical protein BDV98DRAFT_89273 [Pterula gracilis]